MRKRTLIGALVAGLMATTLLTAPSAKADTYNFTFDSTTAGKLDVTGSFTLLKGGTGSSAIQSISGDVTGTDASGIITGLIVSTNTDGEYHAPSGNAWTLSNTFDTVSMLFDGNGVLFGFGASNVGNI